MKASKANIARAVDQPADAVRFYLFHGPDEAQSRALAARLAEALGAARYLMGAGSIKSDPASLVDEASALSLFGGRRLIWIEPAGEEIAESVAGLLDVALCESAVVAIAGALRKTSTLLKLAESSPHALAFAAYAPEGQEAERMVAELGRRVGLKIDSSIAARIADGAGNDQAIVSQELEKMALFIDASPHAPKELDHSAVDEIGADNNEGDFLRLADLAMAGNMPELAGELAKLPAGGSEAVPVIRSLQRRLLMLSPLRARIDAGERLDAVMTSAAKALFWKDKGKVQRMLAKWTSEDLATAMDRSGRLERDLMRPLARSNAGAPDSAALGEELLAISRKARAPG